jgi:hypothetical protein
MERPYMTWNAQGMEVATAKKPDVAAMEKGGVHGDGKKPDH